MSSFEAGRRGDAVRSDCWVSFTPAAQGGLVIEAKSKVESMYGEVIRRAFDEPRVEVEPAHAPVERETRLELGHVGHEPVDRRALGVGHPGQVADRHRLQHDGLLVDRRRLRRDARGRVHFDLQIFDAADQRCVIGHKAVFDSIVHQLRGALQLLPRKVSTIGQQVSNPFVVDVIAPARTKAACARQAHQKVADVRGVQGTMEGPGIRHAHR